MDLRKLIAAERDPMELVAMLDPATRETIRELIDSTLTRERAAHPGDLSVVGQVLLGLYAHGVSVGRRYAETQAPPLTTEEIEHMKIPDDLRDL